MLALKSAVRNTAHSQTYKFKRHGKVANTNTFALDLDLEDMVFIRVVLR